MKIINPIIIFPGDEKEAPDFYQKNVWAAVANNLAAITQRMDILIAVTQQRSGNIIVDPNKLRA